MAEKVIYQAKTNMIPFPKYEHCITICQAGELAGYHCAGLLSQQPDGHNTNYLIKMFIECAWQCKLTADLASGGSKQFRQTAEYCALICQSCCDICRRAEDAELKQQAKIFEQAVQECRIAANSVRYKY